jgi:tetratricopeptide (TPR) repeat protein
MVLSHMGQRQEAQSAMCRARELDPLYAMHHALSSQVAFAAREYAAAMQFARQAVLVDPDFWIGHFQLGQAYVQSGMHELALESLNAAGRLGGCNTKAMSLRGYLFAKMGRRDQAEEVLHILEVVSRERYVPAYAIALVHAGLERWEPALDWLERGYDHRDVHLIFLPIDPKWDPLRDHPRFTALLERCGFTSSQSPGLF